MRSWGQLFSLDLNQKKGVNTTHLRCGRVSITFWFSWSNIIQTPSNSLNAFYFTLIAKSKGWFSHLLWQQTAFSKLQNLGCLVMNPSHCAMFCKSDCGQLKSLLPCSVDWWWFLGNFQTVGAQCIYCGCHCQQFFTQDQWSVTVHVVSYSIFQRQWKIQNLFQMHHVKPSKDNFILRNKCVISWQIRETLPVSLMYEPLWFSISHNGN